MGGDAARAEKFSLGPTIYITEALFAEVVGSTRTIMGASRTVRTYLVFFLPRPPSIQVLALGDGWGVGGVGWPLLGNFR